MSKKRELLKVEWVDSCSPGSGWRDRRDFKGYKPETITSVGFVVVEDEQSVTLAAHWSRTEVQGVMCIPKVAVTSRKVIGR